MDRLRLLLCGQATDAIEKIVRETLPEEDVVFEWTDLVYQEKQAGNSALAIFALAVLLAFLIAAAQYNSWSLPFAVLLIAPMSLLSAIVGVWVSGGITISLRRLVRGAGRHGQNAILVSVCPRQRTHDGADPLDRRCWKIYACVCVYLMTSFAPLSQV